MLRFSINAVSLRCKNAQKYDLSINHNKVARLHPKNRISKCMKFKENHKTALAKVLSDLVQCDGIVNQGEIDFLQRVYGCFGITSASRKKATTLSLSDAVGILKTLERKEKLALLRLFQTLSMSDDSLDPNESLLITSLILSIDIEMPETQGIKSHFVSIPNLNFDTRNAVLYVEAEYDEAINASLMHDYEAVSQLLETDDRELFYLPMVMRELSNKRATLRQVLNYIEPTLSDEQLDYIDNRLPAIDSTFLSKEIFLNYLKTNGTNINKPSFFFKTGRLKPGNQQDFLILEINGTPLATLQRFYELKASIVSLKPAGLSPKEERFLQQVTQAQNGNEKDALDYTGFHKILIDIVLKYNGSHETSRLYVTKCGDLFLTDRNNTEVKMPAISKALYILFLFHEEGIPLNCLSDYKAELYRIYRPISTYGDDELLRRAVENLTDFVGNTLNATLSRIKKAFTDILGDAAASYLIQGEKGGRKTIHLDRSLVVYEDRKAFT